MLARTAGVVTSAALTTTTAGISAPGKAACTVVGLHHLERLRRGVEARLGGPEVFSVADLIADISTFVTLEPGDVITTGTPGGVGFAMTPQQFLAEGDAVPPRRCRRGGGVAGSPQALRALRDRPGAASVLWAYHDL
jgi:hypothetical protein